LLFVPGVALLRRLPRVIDILPFQGNSQHITKAKAFPHFGGTGRGLFPFRPKLENLFFQHLIADNFSFFSYLPGVSPRVIDMLPYQGKNNRESLQLGT